MTEVGSLTCKVTVDTSGLQAALRADGADGGHTSALIVALPKADDGISEFVEEDPHVTLAYFGDAAGLPDIVVQAVGFACEAVARRTVPFTAKVNGKAELGDEGAKVLLLESDDLSALHTGISCAGPVKVAMAGTDQYPEFIPHLTLNYGDTVDGLPDVDGVEFDRIALWVGNDRTEYPMSGVSGHSFTDVMTPPTVDDDELGDFPGTYIPGYTAAITAAGARKFDPSLHPRGPDGRFIKKWGIAKWVDKKTKKWGYGKVVGWAKGAAKDAVDVTLSPTDVNGVATGAPDIVKSDHDLYAAPKVLAHLKKDDPTSKKTGGQAGSNPGGFYELGTEVPGTDESLQQKYYVKKAKTKQHGQNEQLANDLYTAAGVPVPMVDYDQSDGMIYSKLVGGKHDMTEHLHDEAWLSQVRKNFAVDAWLSNWDVFGLTYDNVQTDANGVVWRIDSGGALLYRAMGGPKGSDFGPDVPELKSFRNSAAKKPVYGPGMSEADELDGAQRVMAITPGQIKDMVADVGLPPSVADTLIARRQFIADYYKLDLPETLKTPDTDLAATAAPLIEPADLAKSGGLSRDWQPLSLTEALILAKDGDRVRLPDGDTAVIGFTDGKPLDIIGQQNQASALVATYGGGAGVKLNTVVKGAEKPRPESGAVIKAGQVQNYRWQRGDRLGTDNGPVRVHGVAPNGTYALVSQGDGDPYTMVLTGSKDYTVIRWDAPATGIDIDGELSTEPGPPKKNTYGLAPAAQAKLAEDLAVPKSAKPGDKSMILGDGTKASTGNQILSKMDGKVYTFIKPKGPYAVVTDPTSEHPDEQLLKMASTLAQPGAPKGDLVQPKSANGIIPSVGMTAEAKDGHAGTITMVSPDGKFVFITDATGKKKRKSIGTVTINEMPSTPAPVDTAPEFNEPEKPEVPPKAEIPAAETELPPPVEDTSFGVPESQLVDEMAQALPEEPPTPSATGPFITDDAAAPWFMLPISKGDKISANGGATWQTVTDVKVGGLSFTDETGGGGYLTLDDDVPVMHQPKPLVDGDALEQPEGTPTHGAINDLDIQVGDWILDQYKSPPNWVQIETIEAGWAHGGTGGSKASWYLNTNSEEQAVYGPNHLTSEEKQSLKDMGVWDGYQTLPTDKVIAVHSTNPDQEDSHWVQHEPGGEYHLITEEKLNPGIPADLIEKPGNFDYDTVQEPTTELGKPEAEEPPAYVPKPGEKIVGITTQSGDAFAVVYVGGDGNELQHAIGAVHSGKFYADVEDLPIDTTPTDAKKFADHDPKVKPGDYLSPDGFNWYVVESTAWKKKVGGKFNLTHYQVRSLTNGTTTEWNWHSPATVRWKPGQPALVGVHPPNPDGAPHTFASMDLVPGDKVQMVAYDSDVPAGVHYGKVLTVEAVDPPNGFDPGSYTLVTDDGITMLANQEALGFKVGGVAEPELPEAAPVDTTPVGNPSGITGIPHEPASFADLPDKVKDHLRQHPNTKVVQLTPIKEGQPLYDQYYLLDPSPDATGDLLFFHGGNDELITPKSNGKPVPNGPAGLDMLQKAVDKKIAEGGKGNAAWQVLADVTPNDKSAPKVPAEQPAPLAGHSDLPTGFELKPGFKAYKINEDGEITWVAQVDTTGNPLMPPGLIVYKLLNDDGSLDKGSMTWTETELLNGYNPDQLTEYVGETPQITPQTWGAATQTITGTPLSDYTKSTLAALDGKLLPDDKVYQRNYSDGTTLVMISRADGYHHVYNDGQIDPDPVTFVPSALEEIAGPKGTVAPAVVPVDPTEATPAIPTPPAPTEPPSWLTVGIPGVDPLPGATYITSFGTKWRKSPDEDFYRAWDAIYDQWDTDVTASQADIDDMSTEGGFSSWTAPDPATIVETGDAEATEIAGIPLTGGDIVVKGETGYLVKFNGQDTWKVYNLDGLVDPGSAFSDSTAQWAVEHGDHDVVYGTFAGQSAPAGVGTATSTSASPPSIPVTAANAYIGDANIPLSEYLQDKIQNYLDAEGGSLPPGKTLLSQSGDLYEVDTNWVPGDMGKYIYGGGTISTVDDSLAFGKVIQWNVPGAATAPLVDTTPKGQIGGAPITGWEAKGLPAPPEFTPGTDVAAIQVDDWVFVPDYDGSGNGAFVQVKSVPTPHPAFGDAYFHVPTKQKFTVAPDGTLTESPGDILLDTHAPWYGKLEATHGLVDTTPEASPEPEKPKYPGSAKPSPEEIAAWGGDLTKNGYIPTVGMHVTGKGPMTGMVVTVNQATGMAKVKTSDGKYSTRKVSALNTDVAANYTAYAPKAAMKDVPPGMPLAILPPAAAIADTMATGKHHALLSDAPGVRSGMINMIRAKTPAGKSVVRVNLTLTKDQAKALVEKLKGDPNTPQPKPQPIGGWSKLTGKSGDVAVGQKFAMKNTSNNGWLSDKAQDKPAYTVTSVTWNDGKTEATVGMKHDNGDTIEAKFQPGHSMFHYEWDPTVMPPPPPPPIGGTGSKLTLSAQATAQGWKHVKNEGVISAIKGKDATGNGVLDVTPGLTVPTSNAVCEFMGTTEGLRKITADGVVIEVIRPNHTANPNSWNGVTTITLPEGVDDTALAGALSDLGIDYAPMTQSTAKKHARSLLKSSFKFDKNDVDSPGSLSDDQLFKLAGDAFGISDIGWQDIHIGVDDTIGKTTFFWSDRVRGAIAAKSKHNLVVRGGKTDSTESVASNLLFGGVGGVNMRLTGMAYRKGGISSSTDATNMANEGSYTSIANTATLPTSNPHWASSFTAYTVYHRPEAILGRIGDIRAGSGDAYGDAGQGTNSVQKALNTTSHQDYYIGGGTPPGTIAYIGVNSEKRRKEVIAHLAARGITHVEGRPVADILILKSQAHSIKTKDLPPAQLPVASRPILDLPETYPAAGEGEAEGESVVVAAVDTEAAA